jgi:hypothetical protein
LALVACSPSGGYRAPPSADPIARGWSVDRPAGRLYIGAVRVRGFAAAGFLTIFVGTLAVLWFTDPVPRGDLTFVMPQLPPGSIPEPTVPVSDLDFLSTKYSVVPGGVRSADEVARVVSRDPVVAAHYSDIDVASLRRERLPTATVAHVSYRMEDKVYFTSKPVRIEAGEAVLTDGQKTIRERCGNVISVEPIGPPSPKNLRLNSSIA